MSKCHTIPNIIAKIFFGRVGSGRVGVGWVGVMSLNGRTITTWSKRNTSKKKLSKRCRINAILSGRSLRSELANLLKATTKKIPNMQCEGLRVAFCRRWEQPTKAVTKKNKCWVCTMKINTD